MILSYDVGSMPLEGKRSRFLEGTTSLTQTEYFRKKIVQGLVDKVHSGIDIPNYPQYRDMNEMFLEMIDGAVRSVDGYKMEGKLSLKLKHPCIAEMEAIRLSSIQLSENLGRTVRIKMCITGPYTLSSLFTYSGSELFPLLAKIIAEVVQENIFRVKQAEVCFLSLDEPLLGMVDDTRLDFGSYGREILTDAWETIFYRAKTRGLKTSIHLHNTTLNFFWQVKSLDVVESHVEDPFCSSNQAKKDLEENDKFVKASISTTNFDKLIEQKTKNNLLQTTIEEKIGEVWKDIKLGKVVPESFVEDTSLMESRLNKIIKHFGVERVAYAGPECGLRGFPTYNCALECLRRTTKAIKNVNNQLTERNK